MPLCFTPCLMDATRLRLVPATKTACWLSKRGPARNRQLAVQRGRARPPVPPAQWAGEHPVIVLDERFTASRPHRTTERAKRRPERKRAATGPGRPVGGRGSGDGERRTLEERRPENNQWRKGQLAVLDDWERGVGRGDSLSPRRRRNLFLRRLRSRHSLLCRPTSLSAQRKVTDPLARRFSTRL